MKRWPNLSPIWARRNGNLPPASTRPDKRLSAGGACRSAQPEEHLAGLVDHESPGIGLEGRDIDRRGIEVVQVRSPHHLLRDAGGERDRDAAVLAGLWVI